jgi:hypothetical protein
VRCLSELRVVSSFEPGICSTWISSGSAIKDTSSFGSFSRSAVSTFQTSNSSILGFFFHVPRHSSLYRLHGEILCQMCSLSGPLPDRGNCYAVPRLAAGLESGDLEARRAGEICRKKQQKERKVGQKPMGRSARRSLVYRLAYNKRVGVWVYRRLG